MWTTVVFPLLDPLVEVVRADPSIHVRKVEGPESKAVKVGKLLWEQDRSKAWNSKPGDFVDLEIYVPARAELMERSRFPLIYAHVMPELEDDQSVTVYGQILHLAIRNDAWKQHGGVARSTVAQFARNPNVAAAYESERRVSSLNQFEDLITSDFSYRGMLMSNLPDVSRMRVTWRPLLGAINDPTAT